MSEKKVKLSFKDYIAFIIALLQTHLLPLILIMIIILLLTILINLIIMK